MKIYIHQFLSRTGLFESKKEIIKAIENKEIKANDKTIVSLYYQLYPKCKNVFWKDQNIQVLDKKVYILLNKPEGYISSKMIPEYERLRKKSIFDIIKVDDRLKRTLFCIGRLDEDTSGLILITNDGKLCERIISPHTKISKTYLVTLKAPLKEDEKNQIKKGIVIKLEENGRVRDYKTKECYIKMISDKKLLMTIFEGKKREIKRIFHTIGNKVIQLERVSIGNLNLKDLNLKQGEYLYTNLEFIQKTVLNCGI